MARVGVDVALLASSDIAEVRVRAGGSSSMGEKRNPIDSIRAVAASELATAAAGMITGARLSELDRGIGGWHAEWVALPLVFQSTAATVEAMTDCLGSIEVDAETMSSRVGEAVAPRPGSDRSGPRRVRAGRRGPMTTSGRTGTLTWYTVGDESARPLLMIHALGADSEMWEAQLPVLSTMRRVVMVDLPGHGNSIAGPGPYTIRDLGEDILDVATTAGAGEFDLCGMSLGGLISLWIAGHSPERVMSLIASNTAARIGSEEIWQARIDAVTEGGMERRLGTGVGAGSSPRASPPSTPTFSIGRLELCSPPIPSGYAACCAALRDADLRELVEAIRCPTLVIGGTEDISTPLDESVWLHEHIPGQHPAHPGRRSPFRQSRATGGVDGDGQGIPGRAGSR